MSATGIRFSDGGACIEISGAAELARLLQTLTESDDEHASELQGLHRMFQQLDERATELHRVFERHSLQQNTETQQITQQCVRNLPSRRAGAMDAESKCNICLSSFEDGEKIHILPCEHEFHASCVDKWLLDVKRTCPCCRRDICSKAVYTCCAVTSDRVNPGRKVVRGPDWSWQDQDGGAGEVGVLLGTDRDGWVKVLWRQNSHTNVYRVKSHTDLKFLKSDCVCSSEQAALDLLSVRELKAILKCNDVDLHDCREKHDLVQLVTNLRTTSTSPNSEIVVGARVLIHSMRSAGYNGLFGTVEGVLSDNRVAVKVDTIEKEISVKRQNLLVQLN